MIFESSLPLYTWTSVDWTRVSICASFFSWLMLTIVFRKMISTTTMKIQIPSKKRVNQNCPFYEVISRMMADVAARIKN